MDQQSILRDNNNKVNEDRNSEFHDALEEFPFVDASNSFEKSELDSNNEEEVTDSVISEYSPDSPSSPSSGGLRHRRLVSHRSSKEFSQSQFFKNNPDGLIDYVANSTTSEKLNENSNSTTVHQSSGSHYRHLNDETDASSAITSANDDESTELNSPNSAPDLVFILAELVIKVIVFQQKLLASSITSPIWLLHFSYMLVTDPFAIIRHGRNYMLEYISGIWGICSNGVNVIIYPWIKEHESIWKLCFQIGWGLLWLCYCGFVLIGLLVPALVFGGIMMKWIVEEPIQITEQLTFDYTRDTPMAFVPIISCLESSSLEHSEKSRTESFVESRVIPFGHELQATVSLTLPESDYNRNLGVFQVRVDFLSSDGKPLASTRQPSMLQFKSQHVRLLSTFFNLAPLLTGYSSETQTLNIKFKGYKEKNIPTYCSRVIIEQRAEFTKGGGVPEIYTASLKLETQLPFIKRMLWYWKWLIFMWITVMMFIMELLFTILCCTPVIFPWARHGGGSLNNNTSWNTPRGQL